MGRIYAPQSRHLPPVERRSEMATINKFAAEKGIKQFPALPVDSPPEAIAAARSDYSVIILRLK
jgi:hypothetical protein